MKKIFSLLLGLFLLSSIVLAKTIYSYDKYGAKTGSYRSTSSGYNSYDRYGQKTGYCGRKQPFLWIYEANTGYGVPGW